MPPCEPHHSITCSLDGRLGGHVKQRLVGARLGWCVCRRLVSRVGRGGARVAFNRRGIAGEDWLTGCLACLLAGMACGFHSNSRLDYV